MSVLKHNHTEEVIGIKAFLKLSTLAENKPDMLDILLSDICGGTQYDQYDTCMHVTHNTVIIIVK